MSDRLKDVMITEESFSEEARFFDSLINIFSGKNREWILRFPNHTYPFSKPFTVENGSELIKQIFYHGKRPHELHFSVEKYTTVPSLRYDWDFILDIDVDMAQRKKACLKVCELLDKFGVYYLIDTRLHVWFPPWEKMFLNDWKDLFSDNNFVYPLKYYLEYICKLHGKIDESLWKTSRHRIRVPYTLHLEAGVPQDFMTKEFKIIPLNELLPFWNGNAFSENQIDKHCAGFRDFLLAAKKLGGELYYMMTYEQSTDRPRESGGFKWISKLLLTKIPKGHRGIMLWKAIVPFLVNVKRKGKSEAVSIVQSWLKKCNADKRKDADLYRYTSQTYNHFKNRGTYPLGLKRLKEEYPKIAKLVK